MVFTKENPPSGHYVYAYIRSKDSATAKAGTPYYIGKGSNKRAFVKLTKHGEISPPKNKSLIIIIEQDLTEIGALALERRLIRWYGRKDNTTGILRNKTDGGDGACGAIRSQKHKDAISNATKGRNQTWRVRKVISPEGLIFNKIKDAADFFGLSSEGIRYRCQSKYFDWHFG